MTAKEQSDLVHEAIDTLRIFFKDKNITKSENAVSIILAISVGTAQAVLSWFPAKEGVNFISKTIIDGIQKMTEKRLLELLDQKDSEK